jgi:MFS family permease
MLLSRIPQSRLLLHVAGANLIGLSGYWMAVPVLTLSLESQGISAGLIGVFAAVPWLAVLLLSPFVPAMVQRFGVFRIFPLSFWLTFTATLGFVLTQELWLWFVLNFVTGLGLTIRWVVGESWYASLAPPELRGRVIGVYEAVLGLMMALGPSLLLITGTKGAVPLLVSAGLTLLAALAFLTAPKPGAVQLERRTQPSHNFWDTLVRYPLLPLIGFTCGSVEQAGMSLLPVYGLEVGLSASLAALLVTMIGLSNLLSQLPIGYLADRYDTRRLLLWMLGMMVLGALLLALFGKGWALWPLVLFWAASIGSAYTLLMIWVSKLFSSEGLVSAVSAIAVSFTAGSIVGPVLAGTALSLNPVGLPLVLLGLGLLAWLGLLLLRR